MDVMNITKVAYGCASLEMLTERIAARAENEVAVVTTRNRPTRHAEVVGGSLFWIIKHHLVARQTILGFAEVENEKRWRILLDARLVLVHSQPRRAHQGWRYLEGADAPTDLGEAGAGVSEMPPALVGELAAMGLI